MTIRRAYHWWKVGTGIAMLFAQGLLDEAKRAARNGVLR